MKREFTPISWSEAKTGQKVYLRGLRFGEPYHYGPHEVVNPDKRVLINVVGRTFTHYPEDLAVEVTP